jgi:tRNA (guanine-N7-)-methyltransferase
MVFGRSAPLHIEIGSGKGTFVVNQAKAQPDVDFIGIEWASKFYRHAVDRVGRWQLKNVRMLRTDAAVFVQQNVNPESVDAFHIYFPDPWPKKRHHKRRLISPENLNQFIRCLKPAGHIYIATDHHQYFQSITEVFAHFNSQLEPVDFINPAGAQKGEWVGTNFERKYIKENRPIYTLAVCKRS